MKKRKDIEMTEEVELSSDKLTDTYSFKIPYRLKVMKDQYLSPENVAELNRQFRQYLAQKIHMKRAMNQFKELDYLGKD